MIENAQAMYWEIFTAYGIYISKNTKHHDQKQIIMFSHFVSLSADLPHILTHSWSLIIFCIIKEKV